MDYEERFVVMTISCPQCQYKQTVHVRGRTGFAQVGGQTVACLTCEGNFDVRLPDRIIGGPFAVSGAF